MIPLSRIMPTAATMAGFVAFAWAATTSAMRDFVWADVRDGMIDTRGLARGTRTLAHLGLVLIALLIATLLFNDLWRSQSDLIPMTTASALRGQLVPVGLLPLSLFMLVASWSFLLTGALHAHWVVRLITLGVYALNALGWINSILTAGSTSVWELVLVAGALVMVAVVFAVRWRDVPRPALEFPLLFMFVSVIFIVAQNHELAGMRKFGVPVVLAKIDFNVIYLRWLIMPALMMMGMDIAIFTRKASQWTASIVANRTPPVVLGLTLFTLAAWRVGVAVWEFAEHGSRMSAGEQVRACMGAAGEVGLVVLACALVNKLGQSSTSPTEEAVADEAERMGFPLVLALSVVPLMIFLLLGIAMAVPPRDAWAGVHPFIFGAVAFLSNKVASPGYLLLGGAALVAAGWLARRGRSAPAIYLAIFGALKLWSQLVRPDGLLGVLDWRGHAPVEIWWTVVLAACTVRWLAGGTLNRDRCSHLLVLLLILTLMRQRDFIENPFTPFFGFAGVGFVAFALVWDLATRGAWVNKGTQVLPREVRLFIYLGYMLLTAAVLNWAVTTHDLATVTTLTGGAALMGFDNIGKPLLYAVFAIVLGWTGSCGSKHTG
jgi:hypothetical protein